MTTSSTSLHKRSISLRMAGIMVLALLFTMASYVLQAKLNYPAILLDTASLANSLAAQGEIAVLLGFLGLLLCGVLLLVLSPGLASHLEEKRRGRVIVTGGASGMFWVVSALLGLALVPLWSSAQANAAHIAATITLVLAELATPLLLALWMVTLALQVRAHSVLGRLGASGLLLTCLRSLVWGLNALLPIESGFYATAGILHVLALLGESFWLLWLLLFGFRLLAQREMRVTPLPQASETHENQERRKRRRFLKVGTSLGVGLVGAAFVGARTACLGPPRQPHVTVEPTTALTKQSRRGSSLSCGKSSSFRPLWMGTCKNGTNCGGASVSRSGKKACGSLDYLALWAPRTI